MFVIFFLHSLITDHYSPSPGIWLSAHEPQTRQTILRFVLTKKLASGVSSKAQSAIRALTQIFAHSAWVVVTAAAMAGTPTLGNYPDRSIPLSSNTIVTPDAAPGNTTSINVSTSTNFKGSLEGNPATGVVRVTDAHPAGTYTVTVTAFNGGGPTATKTFALTVTTPATCPQVSFATSGIFGVGYYPTSVVVGDFNGDGKQDLATANDLRQCIDLVRRWHGPFQRRHQLRRGLRTLLCSGGRFQWRWQARPRHGRLWLTKCVNFPGRWRRPFQRRHTLRRWRFSSLNRGGRFQRRWQTRPRCVRIRLISYRVDLVRRRHGSFQRRHELRPCGLFFVHSAG